MDNVLVYFIVTVLIGLTVLFVDWLAKHFYTKKKEAIEKLVKVLDEVEKEVSCFADGGTRRILGGNRVINRGTVSSGGITIVGDGDEMFLNVNGCGGPLSYIRAREVLGKMKSQPVDNAPKWVEKEFNLIRDLLKEFYSDLQNFNTQWPTGWSLKILEQKNHSKISDIALVIEQKADSLVSQITALKERLQKPWRWII